MDQALVRRLRGRVADLLARQRRDDLVAGVAPMTAEHEPPVRPCRIGRVLEAHARQELLVGRTPPSAEDEFALADGIHAALFGVGRLQPLLDDPDVENIDINGCDRVFVGYADGREELAPPVAETDDELVELVQTLAPTRGPSRVRPRYPPSRPPPARRSRLWPYASAPSRRCQSARPLQRRADMLRRKRLDLADLASFLSAAVGARRTS